MSGPIEGNETKNILVSEHRSPGWNLDLVTSGNLLPRWRCRMLTRNPYVAAEAAIPPTAGSQANGERVVVRDGFRVGSYQHMALQRTRDQFVAIAGLFTPRHEHPPTRDTLNRCAPAAFGDEPDMSMVHCSQKPPANPRSITPADE